MNAAEKTSPLEHVTCRTSDLDEAANEIDKAMSEILTSTGGTDEHLTSESLFHSLRHLKAASVLLANAPQADEDRRDSEMRMRAAAAAPSKSGAPSSADPVESESEQFPPDHVIRVTDDNDCQFTREGALVQITADGERILLNSQQAMEAAQGITEFLRSRFGTSMPRAERGQPTPARPLEPPPRIAEIGVSTHDLRHLAEEVCIAISGAGGRRSAYDVVDGTMIQASHELGAILEALGDTHELYFALLGVKERLEVSQSIAGILERLLATIPPPDAQAAHGGAP